MKALPRDLRGGRKHPLNLCTARRSRRFAPRRSIAEIPGLWLGSVSGPAWRGLPGGEPRRMLKYPAPAVCKGNASGTGDFGVPPNGAGTFRETRTEKSFQKRATIFLPAAD